LERALLQLYFNQISSQPGCDPFAFMCLCENNFNIVISKATFNKKTLFTNTLDF